MPIETETPSVAGPVDRRQELADCAAALEQALEYLDKAEESAGVAGDDAHAHVTRLSWEVGLAKSRIEDLLQQESDDRNHPAE